MARLSADLSDEPRSTCGSQDSLLTSLPVDLQKSVMSLPAAADPQDLKLFSRLDAIGLYCLWKWRSVCYQEGPIFLLFYVVDCVLILTARAR